MIIESFFLMFIGLAGGLAVGIGLVAFLTVLGILPRLTQLTKTAPRIHQYEWAVILGAIGASWFGLRSAEFGMPAFILLPLGLACGIFVGMLAAALTEVLNVLPILSKRIGMDGKLMLLLMAIVLGKIAGSLFHWIYFNAY